MAIKLLLAALLSFMMTDGKAQVYDGAWWMPLDHDLQANFAAGFQDCSSSYPKGRLQGSQYDVASYLTRYYKTHPGSEATPVSKVLISGGPSGGRDVKGGEVWSGKHGYYLGEFWGEQPPTTRSSFVEGYVSCQQVHGEKIDGARVPAYTLYITKWLDADNGSSQQAIKRSVVPIADVLLQAEKEAVR